MRFLPALSLRQKVLSGRVKSVSVILNRSPLSVCPVTPPAQLLPTALAATGKAPLIRNNGAAAHQHQWAQGDPWLYAFARLFLFFSYE